MQSFREFSDRVKVTLTFAAEGIAVLAIGIAAYFTTPFLLFIGIVPLVTSIATAEIRLENFAKSLCLDCYSYYINSQEEFLNLPFMFLSAASMIVGAIFIEVGPLIVATAIVAVMTSIWSAFQLNSILGMIYRERYDVKVDVPNTHVKDQRRLKAVPSAAEQQAIKETSGVFAQYGGMSNKGDDANSAADSDDEDDDDLSGGLSSGPGSTN